MQNNYKYLFKNIGLLSLSQFGSKILIFFLLPLYTAILTTEEYGIYDIFNTTISLLTPILSINIATAVIRFPLDKDSNPVDVFSVGIKIFGIGFFIFLLFVGFNYKFNFFNILNQYPIFFICMYISNGIYSLISNFSRGIDKVASLAISGIISSVITIFLNILLLVIFKWGLIGYFTASISGPAAGSLYLFCNLKLWKYISFNTKNKTLQKEMIIYSAPLVITAVSWWINSLSSRYIIILFCGIASNGIYAVASKIPNMLAMFQNIFNQAWILSSVKDFDADDKNCFFSNMYNYYHYILLLGCMAIILFTKIIAKFLYAKDFYEAWQYVPFLTIALLFGAMSGFIGGILSAKKDTKSLGMSVLIGALINIILNFILVPYFGPVGSAFTTCVSGFIIWQIRMIIMKKYIQIHIPLFKHYLTYVILVSQAFLLLKTSQNPYIYYILIMLTFFILLLFYRESFSLYIKIKNNILLFLQRSYKI